MDASDDDSKVSRLRVTVKCRNLVQLDDLSSVNPLVALFEQNTTTHKFNLIDQTEILADELNPNFFTSFVLTRTQSNRGQYMFRVYDTSHEDIVGSGQCIGTVVLNFAQLVERSKGGEDCVYQFESQFPELQAALLEAQSTLFLRCDSDSLPEPGKAMAELGFQCSLNSVRFRDIIPVVALFKFDAVEKVWVYIGQTEPSRAAKNAVFTKKIMIDLDIEELKVSVYDTNTLKVSELNRVGSVKASVRDITSRLGKITPLELQHKKKKNAAFDVVIVTCTQKFGAHAKRGVVSKNVTVESEVDEGPHRIALRDGIVKLESMVLFGRTFHRLFFDPQKESSPINLFYSNKNIFHWCSEGNRIVHPSRSMRMQDIKAIVIGRCLPAFTNEINLAFPDECCFSIVGTNNVLNLASAESRTREVWVFAIVKLAKEYDCEPAIYSAEEYDSSLDHVIEAEETDDYANNIYMWLKHNKPDPAMDEIGSRRSSRVYNVFPSRSEGV